MTTNERPGVPVTPQTIIGVAIIAFGAILMAGNFGWVRAADVLGYWPLILVALGGVMWLRAVDSSARFSAAVVGLIGVWLTAARLFHLPGLSVRLIWPLALVSLGAAMISRAWRQHTNALGVSDQTISDFAFWSGIERKISSPLFRRADFTAVMGGIQADLSQASIGGEAVIDVFIVMGGLEIRVPPDWVVSNQVVAVMGGASDRSTGTKDAKNRLIIKGFVLMGGIEVKS